MKAQTLHHMAATWLTVYPTITLLSVVLDPVISGWPMPVKTLVLTSIMVPVLTLAFSRRGPGAVETKR